MRAGCGSDDGGSGASASTATTASAQACTPQGLKTQTAGKLTVATDKPAYPPYYEDDDPTNGKGFESAVAYAVAKQLGYAKDAVSWTIVPFNSSYAPGPKKFDFDINQISITPQRAKRVDFTQTYFQAPQAVVLPKGATKQIASLADLKGAKIGVQVGTTSLDAVQDVVKPSQQPQVFSDSNDVVRALKSGRVQAVVVDLPTAFYLTSAEVEGAKIAGQFSAPGGDKWGILLQRDSPLTSCVDRALGQVKASGELGRIQEQYLGGAAGAPELR
jgi:polar amino acid transport system substrate-binding protein